MTNWPNSTMATTLARDGDELPVLGPNDKHVLRAAMVGRAVADHASQCLHVLEAIQRRLVGIARDGAVDGFESRHRDLCFHVAPAREDRRRLAALVPGHVRQEGFGL